MKKYLFSAVSMLISIGCMITYITIGSEVLANGTLSEPFFLIPLTYLFAFITVISVIIIRSVSMIKHKK